MKQAVVILHGMGEQIPMQTLNSFVDAVWTSDDTLVDRDRPDPNSGSVRTQNASWAKPDARNSSTELRRITTERDNNRNYTDFYEYYWAHMIHGTTLEHVQTWLVDLLWRNPFKRVPRRVLHAWIFLWMIAVVVIYATLMGMLPSDGESKSTISALASGIGGLVLAAFISNVLIKRFGDVARYVKALPPNVARRQEIRSKGVELLERLIDSDDYDRIVVVAHSLGTIVAYDILSELYAAYNKQIDDGAFDQMLQPERHKLEEMIRNSARLTLADGAEGNGEPLDLDAYQAQQTAAQTEARAQGSKWIISDFITLGAPLTHAEFLMSESLEDLRKRQDSRELPTCPPVLEYDGTTKLRHMSYDPKGSSDRRPETRRVPHHAALFAYTKWTNLYSDEAALITGDIISGPVAETFGAKIGDRLVQGIRDIAVLPALGPEGEKAKGHRRTLFSHNNYWNPKKGSDIGNPKVPHHILELRKALKI